MSDVPTLAAALGTAVSNAEIVGQSGKKLRTSPYLSDTFSAPCALIAINTIEHHSAFGQQAKYSFIVYLVLPKTSDRAAIAAMENYMSNLGNSSIKAAVEADPTLGGIAGGTCVKRCGPPAAIKVNGNPYIGCSFTVELYADN